jgi:hypothetical protein
MIPVSDHESQIVVITIGHNLRRTTGSLMDNQSTIKSISALKLGMCMIPEIGYISALQSDYRIFNNQKVPA